MPAAHVDWEAAFWTKVRERADGCWEWTASVANGYGQFGSRSYGCRRGRTVLAHRIAYEIVVGVIPAGLTIDHLCAVQLCVNPAHLEPVTLAENVRRAAARQTRCARGHELAGANLYRAPSGRRQCRTCRRDALRRFRAKAAA